MKIQACVVDAFLERFGAALGCQMLDFGIQNLQNITKMVIEIDPKSMKNRGCVAAAFLKRFWVAFGRQKGASSKMKPSNLATIFGQKSKKWHPKRHQKIDAEKVSKNDAKMRPKSMQKTMIFHTFSKKAKSHETI